MPNFEKLVGKLNLILSNMTGKNDNDVYAANRQAMKDVGAAVTDRFLASNHIGHHKVQLFMEGAVAKTALFGSTNVTAHALYAQTNNTIIAQSPSVAAAYKAY